MKLNSRVYIGTVLLLLLTFKTQDLNAQSNATKNLELVIDYQVSEFHKVLKILCSSQSKEDKRKSINAILDFFVDGALIEVTSINRDQTETREISDYFYRLMNLSYHKYEIDITSVTYFRLDSLGTDHYKTVREYDQEFNAYNKEGEKIYGDNTIKKIDIDARLPLNSERTQKELFPQVKFTRITAIETSPIK